MDKYRVLCLHGYRQNAEALCGRMSALRRALKSSMEFGTTCKIAAGCTGCMFLFLCPLTCVCRVFCLAVFLDAPIVVETTDR